MVSELRPDYETVDPGGSIDSHALVEHLMTQGVGLISRVVDRVASDLTAQHDGAAGPDVPVDELVADAIADRISALLRAPSSRSDVDEEAWIPDEPSEPDQREDDEEYERLVHFNAVLADALGACDCWGTQRLCPVCRGQGKSGWMNPDPRLFEVIVIPALAAHESIANDESPEEGGDVSDGTGH